MAKNETKDLHNATAATVAGAAALAGTSAYHKRKSKKLAEKSELVAAGARSKYESIGSRKKIRRKAAEIMGRSETSRLKSSRLGVGARVVGNAAIPLLVASGAAKALEKKALDNMTRVAVPAMLAGGVIGHYGGLAAGKALSNHSNGRHRESHLADKARAVQNEAKDKWNAINGDQLNQADAHLESAGFDIYSAQPIYNNLDIATEYGKMRLVRHADDHDGEQLKQFISNGIAENLASI